MSTIALTEDQKRTVAVDLDGVLHSWKDGFKGADVLGDPIPCAAQFTRVLGMKYHVVIWTARLSSDRINGDNRDPVVVVQAIADWLQTHKFHYDEIYVGAVKPVAFAYVDDRAVSCRPEDAPGREHDVFVDVLTKIGALNG